MRSFWSRTSSNRPPPKVRGCRGPTFGQTTSASGRRFYRVNVFQNKRCAS
jgi:hypothetical protein